MRDRGDEGSAPARARAGQQADQQGERGAEEGAPPSAAPDVLRVSGAVTASPGARRGEGGDGGGTRPPMLVLTSTSGATFHLPVDGSLRAALRQASATPATDEAPVPPPLRPKDIQTRIRAGESATELAESSGAPLAQIERYAGPVLAERAHVATTARATVVRTTRSRPTLEELVLHRLASRGVALGTVGWDAWRRGEQGWALQVSFRAGTRDRLAQWSYDPVGESVDPLDDEARWLSASHEAEGPTSGRRLSAVRVFDVETDGGVREVPVVPAPPLLGDTGPIPAQTTGQVTGQVTGPVPEQNGHGAAGAAEGQAGPTGQGGQERGPWASPDHDEVAARTMDLLDALSDRRGRRQPVPDLGADDGWDEEDDDELVDALLDLPPGPSGPGDADDGAVPPGAGGLTRLPGLPGLGGLPGLVPAPEPHLRAVPLPAVWADGPEDAGTGDLPPAAAGGQPLGLVPAPGGPAADGAPWTGEVVLPDAGSRGVPTSDDTGATATGQPGAADAADPTGALVLEPDEPVPAETPAPTPARQRGPRRSSVPSWDEIVFGSPRTDHD